MKRLSRLILESLVAFALYVIIVVLWQMAEVKLYGYSQASAIDALAAVVLALGSAEMLTHGMWR